MNSLPKIIRVYAVALALVISLTSQIHNIEAAKFQASKPQASSQIGGWIGDGFRQFRSLKPKDSAMPQVFTQSITKDSNLLRSARSKTGIHWRIADLGVN